jgi:hypothetical protein
MSAILRSGGACALAFREYPQHLYVRKVLGSDLAPHFRAPRSLASCMGAELGSSKHRLAEGSRCGWQPIGNPIHGDPHTAQSCVRNTVLTPVLFFRPEDGSAVLL